MKQLILFAILLGGCAVLHNSPVRREISSTPAPMEVSTPAEVIKVIKPVVTPVETKASVAKATRYVLELPQTYSKYIPRAEKFYQLALTDLTVLNKSKFDFSDATPDSIRKRIANGFTIKVTTYKPSIFKGGVFSKAIGYHVAGTIYLNTYYLSRPDCEIINTLVHEASHNLGYSHGDNSSDGKDNSVPYWIGDRAEELCKQGKI